MTRLFEQTICPNLLSQSARKKLDERPWADKKNEFRQSVCSAFFRKIFAGRQGEQVKPVSLPGALLSDSAGR